MYTMGIDVGSASSKAVILRDGREVVAALAVQAGTGSSGPGRVLEAIAAVVGQANVSLRQQRLYRRRICRVYSLFQSQQSQCTVNGAGVHIKKTERFGHLPSQGALSCSRGAVDGHALMSHVSASYFLFQLRH